MRPSKSATEMLHEHLADAIASSFYAALRPLHGFTEPRYAVALKRIVFRGKKLPKLHLGYGLKVWPRDAMAMVESDPAFEWLRATYTYK